MPRLSVTVNEKPITAEVSARTLLVEFLREHLKLTGTHVGCDTSQCGTCVVHVNEKSAKSCTLLALQTDGCRITTIEGLAKNGQLHPIQEAFKETHALQCGFCTPGMIMTAADILHHHRENDLSEENVRKALEGNLCRCTGYHNIVKAILKAKAHG